MYDLTDIVGSQSRAEILRLLFDRAGIELYLRDLQRQSELSIWPIQQELKHLEKIGLVKTRKNGNRVYYSANLTHPLFPEIRSLVEKTTGVQALLQKALADPDVRFAFIFGSVVSGKAKPESDLDLFVLGDLGLRKLSKLLSGMTDKIGREVNPHVMTIQEFERRLLSKDHFVSTVMDSEIQMIIGDENELKQLGQK